MLRSSFIYDVVSTWIKRLAPSIVLLVLIIFVAKIFIGDKWLAHIKNVNWMLWLLLFTFSTMNYLMRTYRWRLLFAASGVKLSWKCTFFSYFSGFAMVATPGKVGEFIRMWVVYKAEQIPYKKSIYPLMGDRISDLVAILMFSSLGLSSFSKMFIPYIVAMLLTSGLLLLWLFPKIIIDKIFEILKYLKIRSLRVAKARRFLNNGGGIVNKGAAFQIIVVSFFAWLMEGIAFWLLLKTFGLDISISISISIFCLSVLVGALSMLPGGLGGTEITMVTMLTILNVEMPVAMAVTAIIRAATLWYAAALGLVVLPVILKKLR